MTRKDFELIAKAIKESALVAGPRGKEQLEATAVNVAYALMSTNERFDHDRFLAACGI